MLRRFQTLLCAAGIALIAPILAPSEAWAGGGTGGVTCTDAGNPKCGVNAGTPGDPGEGGGSGGSSGSGGGGYCVYRRVDGLTTDELAALGGQPSGPGAWYDRICYDANGNTTDWTANWPIWLATPPPAVDPAALAREARSMLTLPSVEIRINPAGDQLVQLPSWLSLDPASWRPQSATASVPGVSVTATATPTKAVWSMSDGKSVVCDGPGTPWTSGKDPKAASPDCGYTYRHSSATAAGGAFTVTVTISWDVTWAGAGRTGTIAGLTTAGQVPVRVAESQAVISQ